MPLSHSPESIQELNEVSKLRGSKETFYAEIDRLSREGFSGEQIDLFMYRKHGLPKTFRANRKETHSPALEPT